MKSFLVLMLIAFSSALLALTAETATQARVALTKGITFLCDSQSADGHWSDPRFPGMSALALWALSSAQEQTPLTATATSKAVAYIVSCAQPDGGIYVPIPERKGGGLGNYNSCLCVTALHASPQKERVLPTILAARSYIASTQIATEGLHEGGFGYDRQSPKAYTDLNNTLYAIDAIRLTQSAEESRPAGQKRVDIDWDAAKKYVLSMQLSEGEEKGGFLYNREVPRRLPPGTNPQQRLRATGSMTYAGLLAMLHCQLTSNDPRVRSTRNFLTQHWSLDENYGQGNQGLYFYYNIVARALDAAAIPSLTLADGSIVDWREALAKTLIARQKANGSWVNENNRFWEGDPVLSTSYALLALELVLR
ncbi:MAG: hypothetical protein RR982_02865 [Kiritimatiellia bacterium]